MADTPVRDRAAFLQAYDEAMRRWAPGTETLDLDSVFGRTRVYLSGPPSAPRWPPACSSPPKIERAAPKAR